MGDFLLELSRILLNNRGYNEAWRLQYLSDLSVLPDYDDGWNYYRSNTGAPVDEQGKPVYHHVPKTWKDAETDGQRWRWCLEQAIEFNPLQADNVRTQFAQFLQNQFGVQTMAHFGWRFGRMRQDDTKKDTSGTYELHTLGEKETIARLASGVKRFELPDEFNFIKVYRQVAESNSELGKQALAQLAQTFENRRQYPKAAEYWQKVIARDASQHYKDRLAQIVENWGQFEGIMSQPAGQGATVEFRFRNGHQVELVAHAIKVPKLLDDVKTYLKSNPGQLDHNRTNIGNIGYLLVHKNQTQYLGEQVAEWKMVVKPRGSHFDKRVTVTTPLQTPGAYLLKASMMGGNTSYVIIWISDTSIVKKPLDGKSYYFVADAVSGRPIEKANLEFFGWRQERIATRKYAVKTEHFAEFTDPDGQLILGPDRQPNNYQWLITATTREGRFAYMGFTGVWYGRRYDAEYDQTKVFTITDRPVYRPDQKVEYKFWVRHAQYDKGDVSQFAGQEFTVELHNPKGERIEQKTVKTDAYGGIVGEYMLKGDATLGVYRLNLKQGNRGFGGGHFRVEEYKKPEFEVTVDAPEKPVMLGEKITAKITAKYYFGSPVTEAKVKYKVTRTAHKRRLVSADAVGLVLRAGLLVVRVRLRLVSGLARVGMQTPCADVVAASQSPAAGGGGRARGKDRRRWDRQGGDRHRRGQGDPPGPGPQVHGHRRGGRPVASYDRGQRQRAGGPQAVQGLHPWAAPRVLPRGRHGGGRFLGPHARRQAGRGRREADAAADHVSQGKAGGDGRRAVGPGHQRRGPRADPNPRQAGRAVPAVVHADRLGEARHRGRLRVSRSSARGSTGPISGLPTSRSCRRRASISRARRSNCN